MVVINNISRMNFTSKSEAKGPTREQVEAFANLNDAQIQALAYKTSDKKKKSFVSSLYALPIVDVLRKAIIKPGSLGVKAKAAAKTGAGWGGALAIFGIYYGVKNLVKSKSDTVKKMDSNNPIGSLLLDLGLISATLFAGHKLSRQAFAKLKTSKPALVRKIVAKRAAATEWLNKTAINTKALPKINSGVSNLYKKAPWAVSAGYGLLRNAVFITFVAGLMNSSRTHAKYNNEVSSNYVKLKDAQAQVRTLLANEQKENI